MDAPTIRALPGIVSPGCGDGLKRGEDSGKALGCLALIIAEISIGTKATTTPKSAVQAWESMPHIARHHRWPGRGAQAVTPNALPGCRSFALSREHPGPLVSWRGYRQRDHDSKLQTSLVSLSHTRESDGERRGGWPRRFVCAETMQTAPSVTLRSAMV
jgi:hypothetical protein